MYRVLEVFSDLQDNGRIYQAGDVFPRPDFAVTDARLSELATSRNLLGRPLIAFEGGNAAETATESHIFGENAISEQMEGELSPEAVETKNEPSEVKKRGRKKK